MLTVFLILTCRISPPFPLPPSFPSAYTIKNSAYVLILAFLLPLAIKTGPALRHAGLLQGQLHASDALSIVYLCYLALVVLLTPLLGAVHDATLAAGKRNAFLHVLLGALCVGPIALLALLSSASPSSSSSSMPVGEEHVAWTAVVVVMGCTVVAVEMASALLLADLTQLQGLGTSSGAIAMMNGKASLVGVGLATVLVGIPALVASMALETGPLAGARYACIATVLVNLTGTLYVVFAQVCLVSVVAPPQTQQQQQQQQRPRAGGDGLGQSNLHQQQLQHQHQQQQWTSIMVAAFRALRPKVLFRLLALSPPLFVHFLLLRLFYQAGLRCLTYLGSIYILHNLELDVYIATKAVIMAFCAALLGMGMTLTFLSAHEKKVQKQREASRFRRASSASAATAVGAVIAAARVEQGVISSPSAGFGSSSTALDAPEKTPLLTALALLTVLLAVSPSDVANDTNPSSATSRDLGLLYILASISGICFGFVSTYEKGILASMLWPLGAQQQQQQQAAVVAGIGVGQFCGLFVALSALLEWFPTLLFAALTRYAVSAAMWAFSLLFGLSFVIFAVFVILEGVREARRSEERGSSRGGGASTDSSPPDSRPQLSMSKRMSFFLLRSLPSHLSTIVESPFGGTQHGEERSSSSVSPASLSTVSSEDSLGKAAEVWRGGGRGGGREMEGERGRSQSSIR